jgi:hypothetical protein
MEDTSNGFSKERVKGKCNQASVILSRRLPAGKQLHDYPVGRWNSPIYYYSASIFRMTTTVQRFLGFMSWVSVRLRETVRLEREENRQNDGIRVN